jgi:NAD(P)-dependent dehydrogenase (short-subunit alcohol dehydrogenase family)
MTAPFNDEERADIAFKVPLSRFGRPEEVAEMIYSMSQSTYLNGQVLLLDGGLV